jgi:hypothetical protein
MDGLLTWTLEIMAQTTLYVRIVIEEQGGKDEEEE